MVGGGEGVGEEQFGQLALAEGYQRRLEQCTSVQQRLVQMRALIPWCRRARRSASADIAPGT